MRMLFLPLIGALLLGTLPACNTMEGLGQDIKKGGEAISESADKTRRKISE